MADTGAPAGSMRMMPRPDQISVVIHEQLRTGTGEAGETLRNSDAAGAVTVDCVPGDLTERLPARTPH